MSPLTVSLETLSKLANETMQNSETCSCVTVTSPIITKLHDEDTHALPIVNFSYRVAG